MVRLTLTQLNWHRVLEYMTDHGIHSTQAHYAPAGRPTAECIAVSGSTPMHGMRLALAVANALYPEDYELQLTCVEEMIGVVQVAPRVDRPELNVYYFPGYVVQ